MTKKRKVTYYAFHAGTGTLIDAADDTFVFSDENFTEDELDALEQGNAEVAEGAGVSLMTLVRLYEKKCAEETARARKKRKNKRKKGRK